MSETKKEGQPEQPKTLQKEVSDKYELIDGAVAHSFFPGHGELDLSTMSLKQVDKLVESGFRWLQPIPSDKNSAKTAAK